MFVDIFILTNSPGEVCAWVRPTIPKILEIRPEAKIHCITLPCSYATGKEVKILEGIPGIHKIISPEEWWNMTFLNPFSKGILRSSDKGVVVHMGGDLLWSAIFAMRLGLPAVAYANRAMGWNGPYKKYMVSDVNIQNRLMNKGVTPDIIEIVGDLMVDSVSSMSREEARKVFNIGEDEFVVTVFPGSRSHEVKYLAPFLLKTSELLERDHSNMRVNFGLSPFITIKELERVLSESEVKEVSKSINGVSGKILQKDGKVFIITEGGMKVEVVLEDKRYEIMNASDIALTCPGTVTAELAVLGVPMIVAVPLNKPELVPIDGIGNLLTKIPFVGKTLKKHAVKKLANELSYIALPNIKTSREIVPEVVGVLEPTDVAIPAASFISDNALREKVSSELKKSMGEPGASQRVAEIIVSLAEKAR